jgi:hypothetical protein
MHINHRIFAVVCFTAASYIAAQKATIRIADRPDPKFKAPAITFVVENRNSYDLSMCLTNRWNMSAEPSVNDVTPFYMESLSRGKWHPVIGNDMAGDWISWMGAHDQASFSIPKPDSGTYRVVMRYIKREQLEDCKALDLKHLRRAYSSPFNISER